ncbi:MAG TPA: CHC2 zinc finger domain-containing protein [Candidatus Wunengus sp. YC60]|uniref:CHC2 zinc finger domain-containing protein n=1 Tax=Candidatus Wunengus sp. YC60 TaxID=3367697 RepID=UPI00402770D1
MKTKIKKPNIVSILEREGVALRQKGRHLQACCPLHSEKTASFFVNVEKQSFKCYGCGKYGDSIDFIQAYKGFSFREALRYLNISNVAARQIKPDSQEARRQTLIKKFNVWCADYSKWLCRMLEICGRIDALVTSSQHLEIEGLSDMYLMRDIHQYHLSILGSGNDLLKFKLFGNFYGRN